MKEANGENKPIRAATNWLSALRISERRMFFPGPMRPASNNIQKNAAPLGFAQAHGRMRLEDLQNGCPWASNRLATSLQKIVRRLPGTKV